MARFSITERGVRFLTKIVSQNFESTGVRCGQPEFKCLARNLFGDFGNQEKHVFCIKKVFENDLEIIKDILEFWNAFLNVFCIKNAFSFFGGGGGLWNLDGPENLLAHWGMKMGGSITASNFTLTWAVVLKKYFYV